MHYLRMTPLPRRSQTVTAGPTGNRLTAVPALWQAQSARPAQQSPAPVTEEGAR